MTQIKLTQDHIKQLKAQAHHLNPVMIMGDKGLTEAFLSETKKALDHHELIKVKIVADRESKAQITQELLETLNATLIQKIGHMVIIFKRNHEAPKIFFNTKK